MDWWNYIRDILDPTGLLPVGVQLNENGEATYESLLWGADDVPRPTEQQFLEAVELAKAMTYKSKRRDAYPPVQEQLDALYHGGIEGWRSQIQAIKDLYPKPTSTDSSLNNGLE